MATTQVVTGRERASAALPIESVVTKPWTEPIHPDSKLFLSRKSLLHQRSYFKDGKLARDASHIPPVVGSLLKHKVLPDTLIPEMYWLQAPLFTAIHWNAVNDPILNFAEELGDTAYQFIKGLIDRKAVAVLRQLWELRDPDAIRTVIASQFTLLHMRWAWDLIGRDDKEKSVSRVSDLLLGSMESRSARGVEPIQTISDTWRKLLSGTDEESRVVERFGEYAELKQAAEAVARQNQHPYAREVVADVVSFGEWLRQAAGNAESGEASERTFYDVMLGVVDAFARLTGTMGFDVSQVVEFGLRKQELRIAIGRIVWKLVVENGFTDVDPRAVPKVIAQLFTPYLLHMCKIEE